MGRLSVGEMALGRYKVERLIGQGGLSEVYAAADTESGERVALKVLKPELARSDAFISLLGAEAQALADLQHENIVRFRGLEREDDLVILVLDLVEGPNLRDIMRLRDELFTPAEVLELLRPLADALDYSHRKGIVHGDLKPSNVLMEGGTRPILTDFGLAGFAKESGAVEMPGTPAFMSPEQCRGELPTPASDIYSLGVILYELLCGRPPFIGDSDLSAGDAESKVLREHLELRPGDLRAFNPEIPSLVAAVVLKCLEKRPADRWESAGALCKAFEDALAKTSTAETQEFDLGSEPTAIADGVAEGETVDIESIDWPPPPPDSGGYIPALPQETVAAARAAYRAESQIRIDTKPSAAVLRARRASCLRRLVTILLTILLFIGLAALGATGGWLLLQKTLWQEPPVVPPGVTVTFQGTLLPMPTGSVPILPTSTPMYQLLTDIAE